MEVVILAAGRGSRLRPETDKTHKTLLKIVDNSILEHTINNFKYYNCNKFVVVLGYRGKDIKRVCKKMEINVNFIENPIWNKTNNIYSLHLFLQQNKPEDFVLIDGDIFFSKKILKPLFEDSKTAFLIRKGVVHEEDMKVVIENNMITKISKRIPVNSAAGESIGIELFLKKDFEYLMKEVTNVVENENNGKNLFYEYAFQRLIDNKLLQPSPVFIKDFACEIDTKKDLIYARTLSKSNIFTI